MNNIVKSSNLSKLRHLLQSAPPSLAGRAISTASSPIIGQSSVLANRLSPRNPSPFSYTAVRHFRNARDPSSRHDSSSFMLIRAAVLSNLLKITAFCILCNLF
nr:stomatin-like protein 2, mitochondrial [Ipomoea batatas]GMC96470.1 stomatin-like protein 2, mitochondrial [Ipomoea batatas]GMD02379.1 stomatin-like protein 2, mitochondrial [Ipomoea batatas]GMD20487.1 stomatin-like protein 2, mitochondrial [Ipomoea batatas]